MFFKPKTKQEGKLYFQGFFDAEKQHMTRQLVIGPIVSGRELEAYNLGRAHYKMYHYEENEKLRKERKWQTV